MKYNKPSDRDLRSCCDQIGPDDGADPRIFFRKPSRRRTNRKAMQLCAQIAQTLGLVLAESRDELLRSLMVEAVEPAPDSTRVLVSVSVPAEIRHVDQSDVLQRLHVACGRLRTEAAAAIHRKRVPQLAFRVLTRGEVRS